MVKSGLNLFWEAAKQREDVGTNYETALCNASFK